MTIRESRTGSERATALVVALAVLALFAVFAVSVSSLMRTERRASANAVLCMQARLAARAGYARAVAELRRSELRDPFATARAPWAYGSGAGVPLEQAKDPSYRGGVDPSGAWSGALGGTFVPRGDRYRLRVDAAASRVHLGLPGERLAGMLDTLGQAIRDDRARRGLSAVDPVDGRGARIVALRDARGGFARAEDLAEVIGDEAVALVRDHVTVHAWVDPTTVVATHVDPEDGIPRFAPEPRAPIDVNTAPWPVLVAAISGLGLRGTPGISYGQARAVADEIVRYRASEDVDEGAITTWRELYAFADSLRAEFRGGLTAEQVVAFKVNANPNLFIPELNPDRVVNLGAGKADLAHPSTELTFMTMGIYQIESLGQIIGPDGGVAAEQKLTAVVKIYDLQRLTTQRDLEGTRRDESVVATATFPNAVGDAGEQPRSAIAGYVQLYADASFFSVRQPAEAVLASSGGDAGWGSGAGLGLADPTLDPGKVKPLEQLVADAIAASTDEATRLARVSRLLAAEGATGAISEVMHAAMTDRAKLAAIEKMLADAAAPTRAPEPLRSGVSNSGSGAGADLAASPAAEAVAQSPAPEVQAIVAPPIDSVVSVPEMPADRGGDVFPDGVHLSRVKRRVPQVPLEALPVEEGSVSLWFKLDRDDRQIAFPLVQITTPITRWSGLQSVVSVQVEGEDLLVRSERLYYAPEPGAAAGGPDPAAADPVLDPQAVPFAFSRTVAAKRYAGKGVPNEWHHLRLRWTDGTDHQLLVDGDLASTVAKTPGLAGPMPGSPPFEQAMRIGGGLDADGVAQFRDLTVDAVVLEPDACAQPDGPPPERFRTAGETTVGRFGGRFGPFPTDVVLGTLTWTEMLPEGYAGIQFESDRLDARLGLLINGVEYSALPGRDFIDPESEGTVALDRDHDDDGEDDFHGGKIAKETRELAEKVAREGAERERKDAEAAERLNRQLAALDAKLASGEITQQEYDQQRSRLEDRLESEEAEHDGEHASDLSEAQAAYDEKVAELEAEYARKVAEDEARADRKLAEAQADADTHLAAAGDKLARGDINQATYDALVEAIEAELAADQAAIQQDLERRLEATHEEFYGPEQPKSKSEQQPEDGGASASAPADAAAPSLSATGDVIDLASGGGQAGSRRDGGPGILMAGESIQYTVEFTYDPEGGAPPLNVSPVLDDVTLTYAGPLEVLAFRWER